MDPLPDPTLSLTLPSLHDGIPLDCRVYFPPSVLAAASTSLPASSPLFAPTRRWRGHAAVVAHPYAPMGGSYNDPIVKIVAKTLLEGEAKGKGGDQFVVATFNFRGAGKRPAGRTSWTAKPEAGDYMAVAGFLYYFAHYLDPYGTKDAATTTSGISTLPSPTFLCAGYSYGAMVTASLLPPLAAVLARFARPLRGSPAAEVRRHAARWAAIQNAEFAECRAAREEAAVVAANAKHGRGASDADGHLSPTSSPVRNSARRSEARLSMGVRVGGGGSAEPPDSPWRRSHDLGGGIRRSLDGLRRSMDHHGSPLRDASEDKHRKPGWMARVRKSSSRDEAEETAAVDKEQEEQEKEDDALPAVRNLPAVRPAYLLVSPPVGLVTNLATLSWSPTASGNLFRRKKSTATELVDEADRDDGTEPTAEANSTGSARNVAETKLAANPTLVVYGDADGFVSNKKMRQWTARLAAASQKEAAAAAASGGQVPFRSLEIATAGHFWAEGRTLYEMREAVTAFAAEVASEEAPDARQA